MRPGLGFASLALTAGLLLGSAVSPRAEMGALYLNNYGSGWGVWVRGHSVLKETDSDFVLEIERISVEPNRAYPQSFDISGFKLAYYFTDKESGTPLDQDIVAGPPTQYLAKLRPSQPLVIENMTIAVTKPVRTESAESLILELHVVTTSGVSIGVKVSELFEQ